MIPLDDIDLARLARDLSEALGQHPPEGYLRGKTTMRDAVMRRLGCSSLEAEELVDTMELRGFVRFSGDPAARSQATATWAVDPITGIGLTAERIKVNRTAETTTPAAYESGRGLSLSSHSKTL